MSKKFDPNKYIDQDTTIKEKATINNNQPNTPNTQTLQTSDTDSSEKTIEVYGPIAQIVAKALMAKYSRAQVDYDEIEKKYTLKSNDIPNNKTIYATAPKYVNKEPLVQYESIKQRDYDIVFLDANGYIFKTKEDEWFLTNAPSNTCYTITSLLTKV